MVPVLAWGDAGESEEDTDITKHWEVNIMDHNFIEDEADLKDFVLVQN